jgi:hypothetical protein
LLEHCLGHFQTNMQELHLGDTLHAFMNLFVKYGVLKYSLEELLELFWEVFAI